MATSTTNFGLKKIDLTDVADITVINENWDKIDEQLLKAGESGGTDLIETEASSIVEGDAPEIDPVVMNELNKHYSAKNPHGTTASDVGALPLTGGTLSGRLQIASAGNMTEIISYEGNAYVRGSDGTQNHYADIVFGFDRNPMYAIKDGSTYKTYDLFGTHNKPSGTYTGNGSATPRTITVGGLGYAVLVVGANWTSLVDPYGALCWNPSTAKIQTMNAGEVNYRNGILTMATSSDIFNSNGGAYGYEAK